VATHKNGKPASEGIKKNQSLRKALLILDGMTNIPSPARLQEISKSLNIPQSTLLRFLNTFIDFGYVGQDPDTLCYYLTLKLAEIGSRVRDSFPFQQSLAKYVKEIAHIFKESASLCIENDMQIIYILTQDSPSHMLRTLQRIGHIAPIHATGVGKLHLLNYTQAMLDNLERSRGLKKYTENTITTMEALKKELERVQVQGYALDNEECEEGVRCIAVPVRNFSGEIVAGISLSAPASRLDEERTAEVIEYLKKISVSASREMGWTG